MALNIIRAFVQVVLEKLTDGIAEQSREVFK